MAEQTHQQHIVNADSIFINNRNDKKSSHIQIGTKGALGDNDLKLNNCNIEVVGSGFVKAADLRTTILKDTNGNAAITLSGGNTLDFNTANIDFNSATITNFPTLSASNVSSANGFASLDAELDSLQTNKLNITGHTGSKIFVSTSGGGITTSTSVSTSQLASAISDANSALQNFNGMKTQTIEVGGGADKTSNVDFKFVATAMNGTPSGWKYLTLRTPTLSANKIVVLPGTAGTLQLVNGSGNIITDTERGKLNGIETGATADQTNAEIRTAVEAATDSHVFTDDDHTKLDGIDADAKADQTASEIRTLVEAATNSNVFTDADHTQLATNVSNIATNVSNISSANGNISTLQQKTTGLTYSAVGQAGTISVVAGNYAGGGGTGDNGDILLTAGYDGVAGNGEIYLKTNNSNRLYINSNGDTTIYRKLVLRDNSTIDLMFYRPGSQTHYIRKNGDYLRFYGQNSSTIIMELRNNSSGNSVNVPNGHFGIGGNPSYPLHVLSQGSSISTHSHYGIYQSPGSFMTAGQFNRIGIGATSGFYTNTYIAMKVDYGIWTSTITTSSDRRIKTNIREVEDGLALQQLRALPCVYYEYIDKINKGDQSTIGFIAQDVMEVMPMAVSIQTGVIPNEMRVLEDVSWETITEKETDDEGNETDKITYKLTINDLEDISGNTQFRFFVNNGGKEEQKDIESLDGKSFIFEEKWENVFLYGKEIDDFHVIDKQKIFAMAFSATQQLDRIQQQHVIEIANIKAELQKEKNKTLYFEDKLRDIEIRLSNANL